MNTITVKTSELIGPALDWAVAKCEGFIDNTSEPWERGYEPFAFSTDWSQGGPIIERERISIIDNGGDWSAFYSRGAMVAQRWTGPTPLIAAMRCRVASKLGDTVEIPKELSL